MAMSEEQLIGKLRELRQIKPGKEWVSLTKKEILGSEPKFSFSFFPYLKPAYAAGFIAVCVLVGTFGYGFVKTSLPGDALYAFRRAVHEGQSVFVADNDKPAFQLKLANDRLEDMVKAPARNLLPTIDEFQANISEAVRDLGKMSVSTSSPATIQELAVQAKKLEENKEKIEALGVVIDEAKTSELNKALEKIVEDLIADLENRELGEQKEEVLVRMKELCEGGRYSEALELYLLNQ